MPAKAPRKPSKRGFYKQALSTTERLELDEASQVAGLDQEIAALRLRLRAAIKGGPEDVALVLKGMDVLRRLVATKYGLSKEDERAFESAFAEETLRRMGERGGEHDDDA